MAMITELWITTELFSPIRGDFFRHDQKFRDHAGYMTDLHDLCVHRPSGGDGFLWRLGAPGSFLLLSGCESAAGAGLAARG
jgi:hypothetical protein